MDYELNSVQKLRQAIDRHDKFGAVSDDTPIVIFSFSIFELIADDEETIKLGDLRNILQLLKQHGLLLEEQHGVASDANS